MREAMQYTVTRTTTIYLTRNIPYITDLNQISSNFNTKPNPIKELEVFNSGDITLQLVKKSNRSNDMLCPKKTLAH
jgi:hypothetical protein